VKTQSARGKNLSASCDFCLGAVDVSALQECRAALISNLLQTNTAQHSWRAKTCTCQFIHQKLHTDTKHPEQARAKLLYFIPTIITQLSKGTKVQAIIERTNERSKGSSMQFKGMMYESSSGHFQRPRLHSGSR